MFNKKVFFSEGQALALTKELTEKGFKARWYKVRNRFYVEWK